MHGQRIYRAYGAHLPDNVIENLVSQHLVGDLGRHIWDGGTCGDPGWVYLDHLAINHLQQEGLMIQHVSMFLVPDPTQNLWYVFNPMEPLPA